MLPRVGRGEDYKCGRTFRERNSYLNRITELKITYFIRVHYPTVKVLLQWFLALKTESSWENEREETSAVPSVDSITFDGTPLQVQISHQRPVIWSVWFPHHKGYLVGPSFDLGHISVDPASREGSVRDSADVGIYRGTGVGHFWVDSVLV